MSFKFPLKFSDPRLKVGIPSDETVKPSFSVTAGVAR